jgi:hypothetical protein
MDCDTICTARLGAKVTDRKKPSMAFWASVVLVMALAYPLSFGPACWIASRHDPHSRLFTRTYRPLVRIYSACPRPVQSPIQRFVELWLPKCWEFEPLGDWFFFFDERLHPELME